MKEYLTEILLSKNYKVYLQGTAPAKLPGTFITYTTVSVPDVMHYDNAPVRCRWTFNVILYTNDASILLNEPKNISKLLLDAGFTRNGKGSDIPSGIEGYYGWAMSFSIYDEA